MVKKLKQILAVSNKKVLFVGIGNVLRRDDGIGVYIVDKIKNNKHISKLIVEVSLENYISKIQALSPDILVLVDCINFDKVPGYYNVLPIHDIKEFTMHSHNLSLKSISKFFTMPVFILGIQPGDIRVGERLTFSVEKAGNRIIELINTYSVNETNRMTIVKNI